MKNVLILWAALWLCAPLIAQHSSKWGEPAKHEIELTMCAFDSSANAVILNESASVHFDGGYFYINIYKKIKILNEHGLGYATMSIPYYDKNNIDNIEGLKAHTINFENGVKKEVYLKSEEVFEKVLSPRWKEKRFTFPSVKDGSILEYKYTIITQRREFLESWRFQNPIPTLHSEIKLELPQYLRYSILLYGDRVLEKYHGKQVRRNAWSLDNVPGYEHETNVFCYADYLDQVRFQWIGSEVIENGTINVLTSWEKLFDEVKDNHRAYLNRGGVAREILEKIIDSADSREDKIRKIFRYVYPLNHEYYYYETKKSIHDLIRSGAGNSAEINLLFCLLLNEAGIRSYPVLISRKTNGKVTKEYPVWDQFDHVIVAIEDKDRYVFMDAVNPSTNGYLLPYSHVNYLGYLLKEKEGKWVSIDYPVETKESLYVKYKIGQPETKLEIRGTYSGYFALEKRSEFKKHPGEPEVLLSDDAFRLDSTVNKNLEDEYQDYSEAYYYSAPYDPRDKIFFNLNLFGDENPFKQKERLFPVELNYPFSKHQTYDIQLSPADTIIALPKNMTLLLQNEGVDYGKFVYKVFRKQHGVTISIRWELYKTYIPREYYSHLKEFFNVMIEKMNEPLIVEKKQ